MSDASDADCAFLIDGEEIRAHKLRLRQRSPVFEKMFFGELASSRVTITDIPAERFLQMLRFVYTGEAAIASVAEAWALFYVAHKYLLHDLARVCTAYVEDNLAVGSLMLSYEYAEVYELAEVKAACLAAAQGCVGALFRCGYHMKPSSVVAILEQRALNVAPGQLVRGVLRWAAEECLMGDEAVCAPDILRLLEASGILQYLVGLDFEVGECEGVVLECCKLIRGLRQPDKPRRSYLKQHWCNLCKCRLVYKIAGRVRLRKGDFLVSYVSVNKDAFLFGLVVATEGAQSDGASRSAYEGAVRIEVGDVNEPESVVVTVFTKRSLPYEALIYVPLAEVVLLECDKVYSIRIGYTNFDKNVRYSSVLCNYMSNKLCDKLGTVVTFDEMDGSVIRGICHFPA